MLQYWGGVLKKKFVKFVVQDLTSGGHEGVGSDIQENYSGVADGSAVTKARVYGPGYY